MITWVFYDIEKDKARTKVAKCCRQAGIYRVQYSVFLGDLNKTKRKELTSQIEALMDKDKDKVYIFPMCKADFDECTLLGQAFDRELITDEIRALML